MHLACSWERTNSSLGPTCSRRVAKLCAGRRYFLCRSCKTSLTPASLSGAMVRCWAAQTCRRGAWRQSADNRIARRTAPEKLIFVNSAVPVALQNAFRADRSFLLFGRVMRLRPQVPERSPSTIRPAIRPYWGKGKRSGLTIERKYYNDSFTSVCHQRPGGYNRAR